MTDKKTQLKAKPRPIAEKVKAVKDIGALLDASEPRTTQTQTQTLEEGVHSKPIPVAAPVTTRNYSFSEFEDKWPMLMENPGQWFELARYYTTPQRAYTVANNQRIRLRKQIEKLRTGEDPHTHNLIIAGHNPELAENLSYIILSAKVFDETSAPVVNGKRVPCGIIYGIYNPEFEEID